MANNVDAKDAANATKTFKTTDTASVHTPHINVDTVPALAAGTNNIGDVDVLTIAAGDNNIGNVDIVTIPAVTNAGTFAVQVDGAALTALQLIDNLVTTEDTASANADPGLVVFARRTATPANTSGADLDYEALQIAAGRLWTSATVDAALPAGTNAIGKLAANSGVDIGDVDITSIAAGDNNIGNVDIVTMPNVTVGTMANLTESLVDDAAFTPATSRVLPVGFEFDDVAPDSVNEGDIGAARMSANRNVFTTIRDAAGNERGVNVSAGNALIVDGSAVTQPVSLSTIAVTNAGTFAVQAAQSGTWTVQPGNTANTTAWKVDGSAVTQPVSLASVPSHAVTNAGTFATQVDGAALTALQLIDNIVVVEDAAAAGGESGVQVLAVRKDTGGTLASADGDFTPFQTDANGYLRVNVAAGGAGDGAILDGVTSSIKATVLDFTNSNPLAVRLTDTNGDYIAAGAGTQYTEDAAAAADPIGTALIMVRKDTLAALTSADGDNVASRGTDKGELYVKHVDAIPVTDNSGSLTVDNGGTFAVQAAQSGTWTVQPGNTANTTAWKVDGSAVTQPVSGTVTANAGSGTLAVSLAAGATAIAKAEDVASADADVGVPALAVRKATPANTSGADGDYEFLQMSAGRLWVDPSGVTLTVASHAVTNAGTFAVQSAATLAAETTKVIGTVNIAASQTIATTNAGTFAVQATLAAGAAAIAKAEDDASANLDVGVPAMARRTATPANTSGADLDYEMLQMAAGRLWVDASGVTLTVASHAVTNAGTFAVQAVSAGDVAHDGVDSGNPVKVGAKAIAHGTNPTAVAAADRTDLYANRAGIPFHIGGHPNIVTFEAAYTAAQTDAAIVTVAGGLKIVVTQIQMTADNANTVDVGFRVGFGATTTPTTTGVVLTHPGVAAGSGVSRGDGSGMIGIGADGEDLRITSEVPTTGSIRVLVDYYTIES